MTSAAPVSPSFWGHDGWQPQPVFGRLDGFARGVLGSGGDKVGVPPSLGNREGSSLTLSYNVPSPNFTGGSQSSEGGSTFPYSETSGREAHIPPVGQILRPPLCGTEIVGRVETLPRSFGPQPFSGHSSLPYEKFGLYQGFDLTIGLGCISRHEGRLLPYPDTQIGQEVYQVCLARQGIQIHGPSIRFGACPLSVHPGGQVGLCSCSSSGFSSSSLFGRLATTRQFQVIRFPTMLPTFVDVSQAWLLPGRREIGFRSFSPVQLPGYGVQYGVGVCLSHSGTVSEAFAGVGLSPARAVYLSQDIGVASGLNGVAFSSSPAGQTPQKQT